MKDKFFNIYKKSNLIKDERTRDLLQFILFCETILKHPEFDYILPLDDKIYLINKFYDIENNKLSIDGYIKKYNEIKNWTYHMLQEYIIDYLNNYTDKNLNFLLSIYDKIKNNDKGIYNE